jgi:predicted RNA-binding protein with TRAM domain
MYGNRGFGGQQNRFAPVKVGDELTVKIEAVGEKGDGIAKEKGFVLFVPGTKAGDEVKIRITKVLRKVGFAEVVGKGTPGEETAAAPQTEESQPAEPSSEDADYSNQEDSEDFGEEEKKDEY